MELRELAKCFSEVSLIYRLKMKLFTGHPSKLNFSQIKNIGKWSLTSLKDIKADFLCVREY